MNKKSRYFEPLALAIAQGESIRDASVSVGCAESTAYRLARLADFRQRVSELRTDACDAAVGQLSKLATDAVEVLRSIMQDATQPPAARVTAAKTVLAMLGPLTEIHELRSRLDQIESRQLRIAS